MREEVMFMSERDGLMVLSPHNIRVSNQLILVR